MRFFCEKNRGYEWLETEKGCFRGYVQKQDGTVLRRETAILYFACAKTFSEFLDLLRGIDGCFSVIINREDTVWAAVDVARSMPLYYAKDGSIISDSSERVRLELGLAKDAVDKNRILEIYEDSFVAHNNTIYAEIKQIELGEAVEFVNGQVKRQPYFKHIAYIDEYIDRDQAKQKIKQLTDNMLNNLLYVIGNRQIVISLSGGYDSRYLACSLKQHGIDNVICYTYGKKTSFEIQQSKKVADALGYEWYCVEYNDKDIKSLLEKENKGYWDYCLEHDYTIYLQNYLAVKKLHEKGVFPKNSVFLTGLCNDMPTGSYIPNGEIVKRFGYSRKGVANYISNLRFACKPISQKQYEFYVDEIECYLDRLNIEVVDYQTYVRALDCVTTGYHHSKCFCHMNTVHEYFGYEWLLPCWNKELLMFWYSLPVEMRLHQNLYEEYVTDILAKQYGVGTKKIVVKLSKYFWLAKLKRIMGAALIKIIYPLGIPLRRNNDVNNFALLEIELYKQIVNKRVIVSQRAVLTLLLNIYMVEQRYGREILKELLV